MNKTTEALKLAEEAFQSMLDNDGGEGSKCYSALRWYEARQDSYKALAAIREALAEPVNQEPVAYLVTGPYEKHAFADIGSAEAYCRGLNKGFGEAAYIVNPLYAAPVDAKAIRAEALDEAAKVCEQDEFQIYETAERCAAAIRGLK